MQFAFREESVLAIARHEELLCEDLEEGQQYALLKWLQ